MTSEPRQPARREAAHPSKPIVLIFGPAGSGKTEIGTRLAQRLGAKFVDADSLHTAAARATMANGKGLTDTDRLPWLQRVADVVSRAHVSQSSLVLACSALKRRYRDLLRTGCPELILCELAVPPEILAQRLQSRVGHFVSITLLSSQLADFEPLHAAEGGFRLDATPSVEVVVEAAVHAVAQAGLD